MSKLSSAVKQIHESVKNLAKMIYRKPMTARQIGKEFGISIPTAKRYARMTKAKTKLVREGERGPLSRAWFRGELNR